MAGVRDQAAFALERALQSPEERIQRGYEVFKFIAGAGAGYAFIEIRHRDVGCFSPHAGQPAASPGRRRTR